MPANWTVFDDKKLDLALKIVINASVFMRAACHGAVKSTARPGGLPLTGGMGGVEGAMLVNCFSAVVEAFVKCATLSLELDMAAVVSARGGRADASEESGRGSDGGSALQWLQSPQAVSAGQCAHYNTSSASKSSVVMNRGGGASSNDAYTITQRTSAAVAGGGSEGAGVTLCDIAAALLHVAENLVSCVHMLVQQNTSVRQLEEWRPALREVMVMWLSDSTHTVSCGRWRAGSGILGTFAAAAPPLAMSNSNCPVTVLAVGG